MSFDISIVDPAKPDDGPLTWLMPLSLRQGTYPLGGSQLLELNVTYNYSQFFNFKGLDGQLVCLTLDSIAFAMTKLKPEPPDSDYWKPTHGNARDALRNLLILASFAPEGRWRVT